MYFLWSNIEILESVINTRFHKFLDPSKLNAPFVNLLEHVPKALATDRALLLEQSFFMPNHNLIYTDRMSMAESVEVRVPFLDPAMLEIAAKIPNKFLHRGLCPKWVLKKAMEKFLPKEVIYRKKAGFGAPMRSWIVSALDPLLDTYISQKELKKFGVFNHDNVSELIRRTKDNSVDGSYILFAIICIQIWLSKSRTMNL